MVIFVGYVRCGCTSCMIVLTKSKIVAHFIYPFIGCVHAPPLNKTRKRVSKLVQFFCGRRQLYKGNTIDVSIQRSCQWLGIKKYKIQNTKFTKIRKECLHTLILAQFCILLSCGMVFVTTTASRSLSSILRRAGPEKMPCVKMAYTLAAPASCNLNKGRKKWLNGFNKSTKN